MAQKTAIDWFMINIQQVHKMEWDILFLMAKQIEKEQIKHAYWNGTIDMEKQDALIEAEKFYEETYNK